MAVSPVDIENLSVEPDNVLVEGDKMRDKVFLDL